MAKTQCDLYRSVMDKSFKSIKVGTYPGDGCSGLMIPDTIMGSKLLPNTEVFHHEQQKKLFHRI